MLETLSCHQLQKCWKDPRITKCKVLEASSPHQLQNVQRINVLSITDCLKKYPGPITKSSKDPRVTNTKMMNNSRVLKYKLLKVSLWH